MSPNPHRVIKFRYRGFLTILRYYDDGTCAAGTIRTDGAVHYICDYWSVIMLDRIVESIDNFISLED
jgi:hypothetical protein